MFTQRTAPKKKSKPQFRNYCNYFQESNHSVSNCLRKQCEDEKKQMLFSIKITCFSQYFKAYQNQIHPNEQPSSFPVNCYSGVTMTHEIVQMQEIDIFQFELLVIDHLQFHDNHLELLVVDIVIVIENSFPIEIHHVQDTLNFIYNEESSDRLTITL